MQWANAFDWSTAENEYRVESPIDAFHWNPQLFTSSNLSSPIYSSNISDIHCDSLINMDPREFITQYRQLQSSIRILQTKLEDSKKQMQNYSEKMKQVNDILRHDFSISKDDLEPFLQKLQQCCDQKIKDLDIPTQQFLYDQQYNVFSKMVDVLRQICKEMGPVPEHSCPICFTNTISMVFVPCGHCICDSCNQNRSNNRFAPCHICRQYVDKVIKLYL